MFDEDVQMRMGLDRRPFDKALKGATGVLNVFKGALGAMGASFSLGSIRSFGVEILKFANDIRRTSDALGVNTDFLQTWGFAVDQSGGNAETANKALERFTQRLAASGKSGSDVEVELRKVADQMAAQPDPVKRAKIAFDAFGKSAGELIPLLSGGSKALDAFAKSASKLSREDIAALDEGGDALARMGRRWLLLGAQTLGTIPRMTRFLKEASFADFVDVRGPNDLIDALTRIDDRIRAARDSVTSKTDADKKAAIALNNVAAAQSEVDAAYKAALAVRVKADFDALTPAQKLNELLAERLRLTRDLANDPSATVNNARKLARLPGLNAGIKDLQNQVGPAGTPAIGTPAETARDRAVAANPRLAAMLAEQERKAGMSPRDLAIDASPRMGDFLGEHPGPKMKDPGSPAERTATAVEELLKKAETDGLNIKPKNSE